MPLQVHWSEGLFLQPHHLQRAEQSIAERLRGERRLSLPYAWGVSEAQLSRDELENFRLRFDRLRAVMPSGVEVNFPQDAELPVIDLRQPMARSNGSVQIKLAVPLWHNGRRNTVPDTQADSRGKYIYSVNEVEAVDENTGENPQPIKIRKINARLLVGGEDESDLEVLPLLRVARAGKSDMALPKEDLEFIPPCLVLRGSPVLYEMVRDLSAQVEASRKELSNRLSAGAFTMDKLQLTQMEALFRLRTLNRFSGILPSMVNAPNITPFEYYLVLRELLGELTALHPARDLFEVPEYQHDNLHQSFHELCRRTRELLHGKVEATYEEVDFAEVDGKQVARLEEGHFTRPNAWFLGIQTRLDPKALADYVIDGDRFKLMPLSLADKAIRGIELKWEPVPPPGLPTPSGLYYFRLQHTVGARIWAVAQTERALAIRMKTTELDWSGTDFTLFMTLPTGGKTGP